VNAATLRRLRRAETDREPVVLATRLHDGAQRLLPAPDAQPGLLQLANEALSRDESRIVELDGEAWFLRVHAPAPRLFIVGAVHIAQALGPLAAISGYAVSIIDPRRPFASEARFPGPPLIHLWPDEALAQLRPDASTAIVTLTHDPKLDDPALAAALNSPAFFIGALGSRKTHASRCARLAEQGFPPDSLARLRGPVGLPINAVSASEIAVSILAEIVAVRRGAASGQR
jgi:xanthine dehydrogenase accessory factor